MENPLVSIVVPVYGVEAYIGPCARSLFAQTYPCIEFIFVDDGSPDASIPILKQVLEEEFPHRKEQVRILVQENTGQSRARRNGLEQARGKYVLPVDSDDTVSPVLIEHLVQKAEETQADIVVFDFYKVRGNRRKLDSEKEQNIAHPELFRKRLYTYGAYGYMWNKFLRRELCEGIFYPKYSMHEDIVFCSQVIYKARKIVQLKEGLYYYNRSIVGSATRVPKKIRRGRSARNMLDFYLHFQGQDPSPVQNLKSELLIAAAWKAYTKDPAIFKEYPFLVSETLALPPCRTSLRFRLLQIILKIVLS